LDLIIDMKKNIFAGIGIVYLTILCSCGGEKSPFDQKKSNGSETTKEDQHSEKKVLSGAELYTEKCTACHGSDGNMGIGGAKKIPASTLTLDERITLISNGKSTMPAFKTQLSDEEIKALAEFTMTLK
jgi:cytochrome c6